MITRICFVIAAVMPLGLTGTAWASVRPQTDKVYQLVLKDHRFHPRRITIPADTRVEVSIDNRQAGPAVITSFMFSRQKLVTAHHRAVLYLPPMGAGTYHLFDDLHLSAKATVTVR